MKKFATITGVAFAALLSQAAGASAADAKCGLSNGQKATGAPILVGAVVAETGPADFSAGADAARAYFNCVNENGGINGRPIEYTVMDDAWNPETAAQVATKLVKDLGVVALVGNGSFVEMGVNAKLYADENVMSMASACAVSECFEASNIVSTNQGPLPSNIGAVQWAVANLGTKHVACVGFNIPSNGGWSCDWVGKYMESKGLKSTPVLFDPGSADLNAVLLEAVASGADTILTNLPSSASLGILKIAQEQDLRDTYKWISPTPLYDTSIPAALGDYWNGKIYANIELTPIDGTGPDATNWRAVMEKYARPEDPRDTFAQAGYLSARFFVDTLMALDPAKIDRATVSDAIRNIKGYTSDLMCGPYYVGPSKQHMPNHAGLMVQVLDGGFKVVADCYDIDTAYLDPIRATEKELGITK